MNPTSQTDRRNNNNVMKAAPSGTTEAGDECPDHTYAMLSLHPPAQLRMVDFRDSDLSQVINWTLTQVLP